MKSQYKKLILGICSIMIIFVGCAFISVYYVLDRTGILFLREGRIRILCKTDHQSLLDACRELSDSAAADPENTKMKKYKKYYVYQPSDPEVSSFPQVILDLEPSTITIQPSGQVIIAIAGGLDHFGVNAYPDGYEERFPDFDFGDRKLIDGLWYYDDGFDRNPGYDKKIDALIKNYKTKVAH